MRPGRGLGGLRGADLDGATAMSLSIAFSDAGGYVTDEFKEKAAEHIVMPPSVTPD